jgi:hypothetical protein
MALPIRELERTVCYEAEKARAETDRVAMYSIESRPVVRTALAVMFKTATLKWHLIGLVREQERLIHACVESDFTRVSDEDLADLASSLDKIIGKERAMLARASTLGTEIRAWWDTSLRRLADQVDHLESIAESLHAEGNPECMALFAIAAGQFAMK